MPRELRRLLILLLVLAVLGAGVVWGGRPALYASGLWIDGGSPTIDPALFDPSGAPTPTPRQPTRYAASRAPAPAPAGAGLLGRGPAGPRGGGGGGAVAVTDPAPRAAVTGEAADVALAPASTLKLLTSAAALAALGPDHRFTTTAVSAQPGQVILVGGGDPYLRGTGPDTYPSRASIADLAQQTAQALTVAGTTTVSLGYDDSLFTGPGWNPVWLPGYAQFATPTSALWVDRGVVGQIHSITPSADAAKVFAEQLKSRGISVTGVAPAKAPPGATRLAEVRSLPLELIVQELLLHSDNDATEVLFRHVAIAAGKAGSITEAQAAVPARLRELGLWHDGMRMDDGSGLSRANLATATVLAASVVKGLTDPHYRALLAGLPTAAAEGTLHSRFDDPTTEGAARGVVRAKTGTLTGIHTLAGFTTTIDGKVLAFALMTNDVAPNQDLAARDWLERVSATVTSCGCR